MKYRKKPVEVDAIQYTGNNIDEIKQFVGAALFEKGAHYPTGGIAWIKLFIKTLEGDMEVSAGDYIIRGIKGEFYPCKPDIFEATYSAVSETKTGAELIADERADITGIYSDYLTTADDILKHINSGENYINKLAIAGALIAAEIDRLQNQKGGGE